MISSYVKGRPKVMVKDRKPEDKVESVDPTPYEINQRLTKQKAWDMYMMYGWEKKDLLTLGIPENTLSVWISRPTQGALSWHQQRDMYYAKLNHCKLEVGTQRAKEIAAQCFEIIGTGVGQISCKENITPGDIKIATTALKEIHKITQLEEGKPTSIKEDLNLTQKEIQEAVKEIQEMDPFMNYEPKSIN